MSLYKSLTYTRKCSMQAADPFPGWKALKASESGFSFVRFSSFCVRLESFVIVD